MLRFYLGRTERGEFRITDGLELLLWAFVHLVLSCALLLLTALLGMAEGAILVVVPFFVVGLPLWAAVLFTALWATFRYAVWYAGTLGRRARNRRRMALQGWPPVLLSPRFLHFPESAWKRLPVYEDFLATGWCDRWFGGSVAPLNLLASLTLLEELEREWRHSGEVRKSAREQVDEIAAGLSGRKGR